MISNNLSVICICSILLTTVVLPYADAGGGVPVLASEEFLTIESGFIMPLDSNSIFMQHQIANNYGKPITVTVSSYQSAAVDLIDSVCDPMTIYPQQVMLIPYQPLNLDDLNRYTMLQASIDFKTQMIIMMKKFTLRNMNYFLMMGQTPIFLKLLILHVMK